MQVQHLQRGHGVKADADRIIPGNTAPREHSNKRPGAQVNDIIKNCERFCSVMCPHAHAIMYRATAHRRRSIGRCSCRRELTPDTVVVSRANNSKCTRAYHARQ